MHSVAAFSSANGGKFQPLIVVQMFHGKSAIKHCIGGFVFHDRSVKRGLRFPTVVFGGVKKRVIFRPFCRDHILGYHAYCGYRQGSKIAVYGLW